MTIANCQTLERICTTTGADLYRARRALVGKALMLKRVPESAEAAQSTRLKREYLLLQSLHGAGIAKPLAPIDERGYLALVLEDFASESLEAFLDRELRMDVALCLRIGFHLADALSGIDSTKVIHRDIRPVNIRVASATGQVLLVHFTLASAQEPHTVPPDGVVVPVGDWAYVSPEQTGRMNRPVDYRTAFYSMGVLLYRMLTGQLPFEANDPLEWTHCHIARVPAPPSEIVPSVPQPVSDIVMKLLARRPEDRYQSAHGLRADLDRCLAQWRASDRIDPFLLGTDAIPERFKVQHKLYGRGPEVERLQGAFERMVAAGQTSLATVSGYSGVGKSTLVDALHKSIVAKHGYFISGKFDQYQRDIPYATIAALQRRTATFSTFSDAQFDEEAFEAQLTDDRTSALVCGCWIIKLQARFLAGDYEAALDASRRAKVRLRALVGQFQVLNYFYFTALTVAVLYENASVDEQAGWRDLLAVHCEQLREWSDNYPPTFGNKHALVSAEIARIEGRDADAMRLYEEAIQTAREHGFVQNEGVALEFAAKFCFGRGLAIAGRAYLEQARSCYIRLGASGKVRQLDEQTPPQWRAQPVSASAISPGNAAQLDLLAVTKASQAISGKMMLEDLGDTLMRIMLENAGAQSGYLLLVRNETLMIAAEASVEQQTIHVRWHTNQAKPESVLPASIVNYVRRCQEPVLLDDATQANPFSIDDYFARRQPKSVLCLPIMRQGVMIGLLYVENNLATHAFAPERLTVLELLASQAAISLENAMLYAELREREARIRRLFDSNIIGIFFGDLAGNTTEANDAFLQIVGYTRQDLLSGNIDWANMTPQEYRVTDARHVEALRRTGICQPFEKEYIRKDGRRVPVLVGSAMLEDSQENGLAFVLDLTERKRAEEQLQALQAQLTHATRVTTLGELSASVAHEVGQPLTAIVTTGEACLRWLGHRTPQLEEVRACVEHMIAEGRRAGEIVQGIRSLTKGANPQKTRLELNDVVNDVVSLVQREVISHRVSLRLELAPELPPVLSDRVQLQQVIINFVMNGIQAMADIGDAPRELLIESRHDNGGNVVVAVRDCGTGIDPENAHRLFDAFFSTKSDGMGMGLSICRSIIEAHGGRVWASNNTGRGATFQFSLPSIDESTS
jgi:PAS domain S-box-containing protein